ncbi:RPRD2 protein, partial [Buphagus erythrorhynchus]|nr:RPRD2 protein [Buphagus erythrorhynchus]
IRLPVVTDFPSGCGSLISSQFSSIPTASTNPKAALKSKIVAEFRPQSLIDELLLYKRSEDQIELKEKQLSTMRVDVCSTETLKCLKGKALR